jgi:hypothetical protein
MIMMSPGRSVGDEDLLDIDPEALHPAALRPCNATLPTASPPGRRSHASDPTVGAHQLAMNSQATSAKGWGTAPSIKNTPNVGSGLAHSSLGRILMSLMFTTFKMRIQGATLVKHEAYSWQHTSLKGSH